MSVESFFLCKSSINDLHLYSSPSIDSDVVCTVNAGCDLMIILEPSCPMGFFHVCTAMGVDGYCLRRYLE